MAHGDPTSHSARDTRRPPRRPRVVVSAAEPGGDGVAAESARAAAGAETTSAPSAWSTWRACSRHAWDGMRDDDVLYRAQATVVGEEPRPLGETDGTPRRRFVLPVIASRSVTP